MKPRDPEQRTQEQQKQDKQQIEGEGSRTADRNYREGVKRTVESGRVDELAEEAKQAVEGDEGEELREAEEEAKRHGRDVPSHLNGGKPKRQRPGQPA